VREGWMTASVLVCTSGEKRRGARETKNRKDRKLKWKGVWCFTAPHLKNSS